MRHLATALLLMLAACGGDEPLCADTHAEQAWDDSIELGHKRWCELDGVRDGSYKHWRDDVGMLNEGDYRDGRKCGQWLECRYQPSDRTWPCNSSDYDPC